MKSSSPVNVPGVDGAQKNEERPQLYVSGAHRMDSRWAGTSSTDFPYRYRFSRASLDKVVEIFPEFLEAAGKTRRRFWLVDRYFFAPDAKGFHPDQAHQYYRVVANMLLEVAYNSSDVDIRILTSQGNHLNDFWNFVQGELGDRANSIDYTKFRKRVKVSTELGRGAPPIHDRFAILDETLWHFGAKVGGLHPDLSANSGAWDAELRGAIGFFENLWDSFGP